MNITKRGVSAEVATPVASPLWHVNFALIYTLNHALAADMPSYWAHIPSAVERALGPSPSGEVPDGAFGSAYS